MSVDPIKPNDGKYSLGPMPVAVMQALYHEITGNTETLSKGFKEARLIRKNDIEQLCVKLHQICAQYNVVGESATISIRHVNSMVQKVSSLEKFRQYDESIPHAIDTVTIEYSALIQVPATKKHYQYKIEVVLESIDHDHSREFPPDFILISMFDFEAIRVKIEYIDYVVARTFLASVEEWVTGLQKLEGSRVLLLLQRLIPPRSPIDVLGRATAFIGITASLIAMFQLRPHVIVQNDIFSLANFAIISIAIYSLTRSSLRAAYNIFQNRILRYNRPSLILINRGDQENFERFESSRRSSYKAAAIYFVEMLVVVGINVLSNKIYDAIK